MRAPSRRPDAPRAPNGAHAGQALVEYLLVLAVIALVCIPAPMFVEAGITRAFGAHTAKLNAPSFLTYPSGAAPCTDELWATWTLANGPFATQGDCMSWVAAHSATPTP